MRWQLIHLLIIYQLIHLFKCEFWAFNCNSHIVAPLLTIALKKVTHKSILYKSILLLLFTSLS